MDESQLVFIVSQPRAGSTLSQAIISNHPEIDTISEHWMLLPFLSIFKPELIDAKYDYALATDAFTDFINKTEGIERFKEDYKEFILAQYAKMQTTSNHFVVDKTPRYYELFDVIYELFPRANYIILKRNPVAVLNSIMTTWDRYSFRELARHHIRDIFHAPYLLRRWEEQYGDKDNVQVLRYEDIVSSPEKIFERLFKWLQLDYKSAYLDYSKNTSFKGKYGDPKGVHSNQTPVKDHSSRWKNALKDKRREALLNGYGAALGVSFLEDFSYESEPSYRHNVKFNLFRYYCSRLKMIKSNQIKDRLIRFLLKTWLREPI